MSTTQKGAAPAATRKFRRIDADASPWTPEKRGDVLEGTLRGIEPRKGDSGDYEVAIVRDALDKLHSVSGVQVVRALKECEVGAYVRVTYDGTKRLSGGRTMKEMIVEVAE